MPEAIRLQPTALHSAAAPRDQSAKVRDDACQFESLLIAQMMKTMRESKDTDADEDQAGATATEMAEEQFAQALSRQGGLGLARMVVSGLQSSASPSHHPSASPAPVRTPPGSAE